MEDKLADFKVSYDILLKNEGGYVNDPDDSGGETYKGVARNYHQNWQGWVVIDSMKHQPDFPSNLNDNQELNNLIAEFYENNFWDKVKGNDITEQGIAESIFDFAVNAGIRTSSKLAQKVVGANPDGKIGPNTLAKLNSFTVDNFKKSFALAKIEHYADICKRKPSNKKFLLGWINRTLSDLNR